MKKPQKPRKKKESDDSFIFSVGEQLFKITATITEIDPRELPAEVPFAERWAAAEAAKAKSAKTKGKKKGK